MTADQRGFPGVHLCGSLPFGRTREAFHWIHSEFEALVRRVPDETGVRAGFIFTQRPHFTDNPAFEAAEPVPGQLIPLTCARLRHGVTAADVRFERFHYADAAKASFAEFHRAKRDGLFFPGTKFMFPIPSPLTPVAVFVAPDSQGRVLPAYEARLQESISEILALLPHSELAIQWDVPVEVVSWDGMIPNPLETKENLLTSMARLGNWIPEDVELGYHLCYGNSETIQHPSAPDTTGLAEIWRGLRENLHRTIDFVHMSVPMEWHSVDHYRPLAEVEFDPGTDLYLGLVHYQDGAAGARRRAETAARVLDHPFGISTECGMGRYGSEEKFQAAVRALRTLAEEKSQQNLTDSAH
ncbi:hypothetical protein NDR87_09575 [Nocardia sp. CDC159]|uniref:Methionine synthase II (Cobalamin-independent) n=1 Tax=Nocardia pulmonis TaxID=2951408 RepID=A0A9X2E5Z3_9NOCA|nr:MULTISPECIES: hypothetical protein [Nocardia]MCM6773718.1 hypothetical protein [Nocardia pulmonis]MCM6786605.1 hypothetical protein [Nocardia sp. CDC159]